MLKELKMLAKRRVKKDFDLRTSACPKTNSRETRNSSSVIARSDQGEGRGNPSCLEVCGRGLRFASWITVDRHGLRPRDDNTRIATIRESALPHDSVIARSDQGEGRGNPSCLEVCGRGLRFASWITVDRHGLRPRDDKGEIKGLASLVMKKGRRSI